MNNFCLANKKMLDTPLDSLFQEVKSDFIHNSDFDEKKSDYPTSFRPISKLKSALKWPNS
ncbi:MAG: hypothetical protein O3C43_08790 [Verrucomicrobia bacterium]|nr:hypothetical protein [Verrucomicrobiota bacterium]